MFRTLALSTLALLALDGTTTALAPATGLSLTAEAAADDDDQKASVKKATVKTKSTSSGSYTHSFWIKPTAKSASTVGSVTGTISDPTTGEILEQLELTEGIRARLIYAGTLGEGASDDLTTYTVFPEPTDTSGLEDAVLEGLATGLTLDDSGEGVLGPLKVRARFTADGSLQVKVMHEDKDWDPDLIASVQVADAEGSRTTMALDEVRQVFKQELTCLGCYIIEDEIMLRASVLDGDGNELDSFQQRVTLTEDTRTTPGLSKATLKETKRGDTKLVTWTDSDGTAAALEVDLVDNATGESVLMTTDDTPILTVRGYLADPIEFDPGEAADGYVYLTLIDLIDEAGNPVGEQLEAELTVPSYDAETDTDGENWSTVTDSTGAIVATVGFLATAEGQQLAMAYSGEDARSVTNANLIFEEPYEGPAPLETEVSLSLRGELAKWSQKAEGSVPDGYTLTTTLVTPEGEVLHTTTATGSGPGTVYQTEGNGKGTRKGIRLPLNNHLPLL